jgi:hypothetical protein
MVKNDTAVIYIGLGIGTITMNLIEHFRQEPNPIKTHNERQVVMTTINGEPIIRVFYDVEGLGITPVIVFEFMNQKSAHTFYNNPEILDRLLCD